MIDLHVHSTHSVDSKSRIKDIVSVAKLKGLKYVGITDHYEIRNGKLLYSFDFDKFFEDIERNYDPEVVLLKGIEWGWDCTTEIPDFEGFDYVSLSIHRCDTPKDLAEKCYEEYYQRMKECVEKADFDVLAHFDFIRRFVPGNPSIPDHMKDLILEILKTIKEKEAAVEINTKPFSLYGEPHPEYWIIEKMSEMGIPVTVGSDAHNLENVGRDVDRALRLIKKAGYDGVVIFKKRKKEFIKIQSLL